jgi:hypothetical protein
MSSTPPPDLLGPFLAAADSVGTRADVDAALARELMTEAAQVLHNSLALDHLDAHDRALAVSALAADLTSLDPGAAVRTRAEAVDGTLHDPEGTRGSYLAAVQVLGL